jgi:enoyl-CoA hydratase/carnithine racemase
MGDQPVIYTSKDHIGYITLNRPASGNRIDLEMALELAGICSQINGDKNIYLAVITGAGDAFCSGGEIDHANFSPSEAIASITHPTLAAINGDAIGEGLEITLSCDLRIASVKARFGLPQIIEGLIPMSGGTQRLTRIVGRGKALEMVLTGESIDARTAFEIGLVNKIVDPTNLQTEVDAIANNLAGKAPFALQYVKEAVNKGLDMTLEQGLKLEADLYFLLHTTFDRTEGITAFLQKRKPEYKGE